MTASTVQRWAFGGFLAYLAVVFVVVFGLKLSDMPVLDLVGGTLERFQDRGLLIGVRFGHIEAAANVLFFVPLGILLPLVLKRHRFPLGWLCAVALSIGIEVVQYLLLANRVGSARDIVCNSLGAAIGVLAALTLTRYGQRRRNRLIDRLNN